MAVTMYKGDRQIQVGDDLQGQAVMAKYGWTVVPPVDPPKRRGRPPKAPEDDNGE